MFANNPSNTRKPSKIVWIQVTIIISGFTFAIGLLYLSSLSFEVVSAKLIAHTLNGHTDVFNQMVFEKIRQRIRICSIFFPLFACGIAFSLKAIKRLFTKEVKDYYEFQKSILPYVSLKSLSNLHLISLGIITVIAITIRLVYINQPIRDDEAWSFLHFASKPLFIGISLYTEPNNHLFNTLLMHFSCLFFGNSLWAIRLPAFTAGILMVPSAYLFARMYTNRNAAIMLAALVGSSSILIEYSTNGRGYTILICIFMIVLCLCAYSVRRPNLFSWTLIAFLAALGFFTIPTMLYCIASSFSWLFLTIMKDYEGKQRIVRLKMLLFFGVACALFSTLFYAPAIAVSGMESLLGNPYVEPKSYFAVLHGLPRMTNGVLSLWMRDTSLFFVGIFAIGIVFSMIFHKNTAKFGVPLLAAAFLAIVPIVIMQRVLPYARVWLFLLPLFFSAASAGLVVLFDWAGLRKSRCKSIFWPVAAVVLCIYVSISVLVHKSILTSLETGTLVDAEPLTQYLLPILKSNDKIVVVSSSQSILQYYFKKYEISAEHLITKVQNNSPVLIVVNPMQTFSQTLSMAGHKLQPQDNPILLKKFQTAELYSLFTR